MTPMDIRMSGMNGVDNFGAIREMRPEALVIMMTAYAADELVGEVTRVGARGLFYKPLDIEEALGLIERAT